MTESPPLSLEEFSSLQVLFAEASVQERSKANTVLYARRTFGRISRLRGCGAGPGVRASSGSVNTSTVPS